MNITTKVWTSSDCFSLTTKQEARSSAENEDDGEDFKQRRENVKGAFYAYPDIITGKRIILVDDICTMGETLRACADALKEAGAKEIIGVTLCVSKVEEKSFNLY